MEALKRMNLEVHIENKENIKGSPSGLGGWLIVTQIALFVSLLMNGIHLIDFAVELSGGNAWEYLTSDFKAYLIFIISYSILLCLFLIFIITQFYRKKAIVPKMMIAMYCANIAVSIIDFILFQQVAYAGEAEIASLTKAIIQAIISAAIWIPYFMKSKRVKNTFVA